MDAGHRIETVQRFHVPGHTVYKDLRCSARQYKTEPSKNPRKEDDPPPARASPNGPPNALKTAGLVLRYKAGCFFVSLCFHIHCRGPPPRLIIRNQTKEVAL